MLNEIDLSELLCAKFCHDMAGPIGAINNGMEFLKEENNSMRDRAYQLVEVSAKQSVARLQFFRQLYGAAPRIGEANLSDTKLLINNFFTGGKSTLDWPDENISMPGMMVSNRLAKVMLNIINVSSNILIYGGKVSVRLIKLPNGKRIKISSIGANIKLDDETINILSNQLDGINITTKNVQTYLTLKLLNDLDAKIVIEKHEDQVNFLIDRIKE